MAFAPKTIKVLKVLCGLYVLLVILFLILGFAGRKEHEGRDEIVKDLVQVAKRHDLKLSERDALDMFERYLAKKGDVFGLNYTVIMQVINFVFLLVILYLLLWQPMIAFLDKRREDIRQNIESARERNASAEKVQAEYEGKLAESRAERQAMIEDGKKEGRKERDEIITQAQSRAERIVEDASRETVAEVARAREELRGEIGSLSVQVAQRILKREIQPADHDAMVDDLVRDLESADLKV